MTDSSIPVSSETRCELKDLKRDGESYDTFLQRTLLDGSDGSDTDVSDVLARLDDLESTLPKQTAEETVEMVR